MRQSSYLNGILTVNAVLLAGLVWTQVAETPILAENAMAQRTPAIGIPNASLQRIEMINALRDIRHSVESTRQAVQGGEFSVKVTNLDEIKLQEAQPPTRQQRTPPRASIRRGTSK